MKSYVIAIVFVWEALNGTIALLCCHVSMKLDVGLTKEIAVSSQFTNAILIPTSWPSASDQIKFHTNFHSSQSPIGCKPGEIPTMFMASSLF